MEKVFDERLSSMREDMQNQEKDFVSRERVLRQDVKIVEDEKKQAEEVNKAKLVEMNKDLEEAKEARDQACEEKYALEGQIDRQRENIDGLEV